MKYQALVSRKIKETGLLLANTMSASLPTGISGGYWLIIRTTITRNQLKVSPRTKAIDGYEAMVSSRNKTIDENQVMVSSRNKTIDENQVMALDKNRAITWAEIMAWAEVDATRSTICILSFSCLSQR